MNRFFLSLTVRLLILCNLLLVIVFASSCSRDDDYIDPSDCPLKQPGYGDVRPCLHGFFFEKGSYWIYEEETTLKRDCTYVHDWADHTYGYHGGPGNRCGSGYADYVNMIFRSSRRPQFVDVISGTYIGDTGPGATGHTFFHCQNGTISLEVNGTTYDDVYKGENVDGAILYYKPFVGVVRIEEPEADTPAVYNLIQHEVTLFDAP